MWDVLEELSSKVPADDVLLFTICVVFISYIVYAERRRIKLNRQLMNLTDRYHEDLLKFKTTMVRLYDRVDLKFDED